MGLPLLPTTIIGSYPQPDWLVDRELLKNEGVPRVRAKHIWRVKEPWLQEAQDDATLLAIRELEELGIDIITDGEIRRESYSNRFAAELEGIDLDNPASTSPRPGVTVPIPRVVGPVKRAHALEVEDMKFLRAHTTRMAKITLPGPFTLGQQAKDDYYGDKEAMIMAFADAVNAEARELQAAGADVIQLDEPWVRHDPAAADRYAVKAIDRAFEGITVQRAVHLCFGYGFLLSGEKPNTYPFLGQLADSCVDQVSVEVAQPKLALEPLKELAGKTIMFGVLDLATDQIETPEQIAERIRAGLKVIPAEQMMPAPDCGMKYLDRAVARGKLKALAEGAAIVRRELTGK